MICPGGFYIPHSDSDIFDQKEKWKKLKIEIAVCCCISMMTLREDR